MTVPEIPVLYFAQLRDRLGRDADHYTLPAASDTTILLALVAARHPLAAAIVARCRVAVDHQFVTGAFPLLATSEVALIPPVSGG